MKRLTAAAVTLGVLIVATSQTAPLARARVVRGAPRPAIPATALQDVVKRYCQRCHSDVQRKGNMSLQAFDVTAAPQMAEIAEKMVAKLRSGMMPPPGNARPTADTLAALTEMLETQLDS